MDNICLDPASNEPARQPEAVAASLIGQRNSADRPASTHRLVPPPLDQSQQCRRIWLISTTTTKVEIGSNAVRFRLRSLTWATGQPPSVRMDDEGATTSAARPIASPTLGVYQRSDSLARDEGFAVSEASRRPTA